MLKNNYYRISIDEIAKQTNTSGTNNFVVSEEGANIHAYPYDLQHPHLLEGIAFAICRKGTGRVKINLQEYVVETNSILIILPNSIIQILEKDKTLQFEFLFFSFDFISDSKLLTEKGLLDGIEQVSYLKLSQEAIDDLLEFHNFIVKQYKKATHPYRERIAKTLLQTLIYEVLQLSLDATIGTDSETLSRQEEILQQFIKLLFKHHRQERSIAFYANKMCLTPKYLSKVIKETTGKSIPQWIDEMVIMVAKALLKSSGMTVSEISEELNFATPSLFCRYFKKNTGLTPIQYRVES